MTIGNDGPGAVALGAEDGARASAAIKAALRIANDDDDALILGLANAALGMAEQFLGQMLIARTVHEMLPATTGWQRMVAGPVRSITAVAGVASDGSVTTLPVIAYAIDIDVRGDGWVRLIDAGGARRVQVTATAGCANGWDALPPTLRHGVVMLAAYLFSERDMTRPPPAAITAFWRPFRRMMLGQPVHAEAVSA